MSSKADTFGASPAFSHATTARSARSQLYAQAVGKSDPATVTELPVADISQNPDNPRDHMRDLEHITDTVHELGVINAITVATVDAYLAERPGRQADLDPGAKYLVVDGHRRLEAARRAGLQTIKVQVDDARVSTDEALLETAFVANYHRDNMTELEEAHALEALVKFYGSQTKASKRLGIPQNTISQKLSILKLTPELQADLAEGRRTVEHVRNLGKLSPEEQRAKADARAAAARQMEQPPDTETVTDPEAGAAEPAANYHAVIIDEAEPTQQTLEPSSPKPVPVPTPPTVREVPEPRTATAETVAPEPPAVPVKPQVKMPWDDGLACAALAIAKMSREQRIVMRERLEEEERREEHLEAEAAS